MGEKTWLKLRTGAGRLESGGRRIGGVGRASAGRVEVMT